MFTENDIKTSIKNEFPDFQGDPREALVLYLGDFTSYLGTMSENPKNFRVGTEKICNLLNEIYNSEKIEDVPIAIFFTLRNEVLEFYAFSGYRESLAKEFLRDNALMQLKYAKETVGYWHNVR